MIHLCRERTGIGIYMHKYIEFIRNPSFRFDILTYYNIPFWMSDEQVLRKKYKYALGKELNLEHPVTYTEKLQWLKLHDRKPIYTTMVDKYASRKWVADKVGEEYVIPILGVWNRFDEIDFDSLPNQFVLKTTRDSGVTCICRDKGQFNKKEAKKRLEKSLRINYFYRSREWPYKNVPPRIIAEKYLQNNMSYESDNGNNAENVLTDYKFFCFHGEPKVMACTYGLVYHSETDFFDMNFQRILMRTMPCPYHKVLPEKPRNFELMKQFSTKLSQGIPHLRCDFLEVNGKLYVGELTFYHWGGFHPFYPDEWNRKMGDWIHIDS